MLAVVTACGGHAGSVESDASDGERRLDAGFDAGFDAGVAPTARRGLDGGLDANVVRHDASRTPIDASFVQCATTRIDAETTRLGANVVWVIDTSGSMEQEAALIQQNLNRFVQTIVAGGLPDYRVVLMSKRGFISVPDPLASDASHFLFVDEVVDSPDPLADLVKRLPDYGSFLLPNVTTHFIVVTDDDSWAMTARDFRKQIDAKLGSNFRVHAIASPPEQGVVMGVSVGIGCRGGYGAASHAGQEYWTLAKLTRGLTFSICSQDWSSLFDTLAKATIESAPVPCFLALPVAPADQLLDLDEAKLAFVAPDGSEQALTRVEDPASCGDTGTWYFAYDKPEDVEPSFVQLCQDACDLAASGGALKVTLSCFEVAR